MKTLRRWFLAAVCLCAVTAMPLRAAEANSKSICQKTLRATALVVSGKGQGTAWVVSKSRKQLVTSQHVAGRGEIVQVLFPAYRDGHVVALRAFYKDNAKGIHGKVVRSDARRDLALIELDSLPEGVAELKLAGEAPGPGDSLHTVGCPGQSRGLWVYSHDAGRSRRVDADNPAARGLRRRVSTRA